MLVICQQILILFTFVFLGYFLCKRKMIPASCSKALSILTVNIFLPCKVFNTFANNLTIDYIKNHYTIFITAILFLLVLLICAKYLSKLFSNIEYEQKMYWHALIVPNISYFGYVLADNLYSPEVLLNVMIFSLPILIFNNSFGYCILTKTPLRMNCLLKPNIFAILIGALLGLCSIHIPDTLTAFTQKASSCVGPVSMLLTGMVISEYPIKELIDNNKAYIITIFRLLIIPAIFAWIVSLFFNKSIVLAAILVYAMPCPMNTIVFARLADENCQIGAEMVLISTLSSIITIPLLIYLFT